MPDHLDKELEELVKKYPARPVEGNSNVPGIPSEAVLEVTDFICLVVADVLQAWLDAGSEREVTLEDSVLWEGVQHAVVEWAVRPDGTAVTC